MRPSHRRGWAAPWLGALACLAWVAGVHAQSVVRNDERLAPTRPEAWAMGYVAAATLMTAFGETPALDPWRWDVAVDLRHVPRLGAGQRQVGFFGTKQEDLNKSPAFGRLRLRVGLPAGLVADLGYTPPVRIRGARPRDLVALALGRRVFAQDGFTVSMRAFGQHGRAAADVTCPARLAGAGPAANPFGCRAPSNDRIALRYYGVDATAAWTLGAWRAHASAGVARTELTVQVDALTFEVRDRSRLVSRATRPFAAIGARLALGPRWSVAAELLHVPLRVRRAQGAPSSSDPFTAASLQLRYHFD